MPELASVQVGLPCQMGREGAEDPMERPWTSAIVKRPIEGPVRAGRYGLAGDSQVDQENHGGIDKAVLCYSADHYPGWLSVLGPDATEGGAFGENLTIRGLTEHDVCIGDVWQAGALVLLQVSQPRQPCWKLARRWRVRDLAALVQENGCTGWYVRVLQEGEVQAGQTLKLLERPHPVWTVAAANRVMHQGKEDLDATLRLASLPELAASWQRQLLGRAARAGNL